MLPATRHKWTHPTLTTARGRYSIYLSHSVIAAAEEDDGDDDDDDDDDGISQGIGPSIAKPLYIVIRSLITAL